MADIPMFDARWAYNADPSRIDDTALDTIAPTGLGKAEPESSEVINAWRNRVGDASNYAIRYFANIPEAILGMNESGDMAWVRDGAEAYPGEQVADVVQDPIDVCTDGLRTYSIADLGGGSYRVIALRAGSLDGGTPGTAGAGWSANSWTPSGSPNAIATDGGVVAVASDNTVRCYDADGSSLDPIWTTGNLGGEVMDVYCDGEYVWAIKIGATTNNMVIQLNRSTGAVIDSALGSGTTSGRAIVVAGDMVIFTWADSSGPTYHLSAYRRYVAPSSWGVSGLNLNGTLSTDPVPRGLASDGRFILTLEDGSLRRWSMATTNNASNPDPVQIEELYTPALTDLTHVAIDGRYIYVVEYDTGNDSRVTILDAQHGARIGWWQNGIEGFDGGADYSTLLNTQVTGICCDGDHIFVAGEEPITGNGIIKLALGRAARVWRRAEDIEVRRQPFHNLLIPADPGI